MFPFVSQSDPANRGSHVTTWMFAWQNWSGAICISYYSPTLFKAIGIADTALYTGIYGIFKATGAIIFCAFIVDHTGRRKPWLLSASVCSLSLLIIGVILATADPTAVNPSASVVAGGKACTAFVMIYALL